MATSKMTIGQLAQAAGVTVETVRYYQRRGLLRRPHRPATGYRTYSDEDVTALRFIKRAQALGFALEEVKELMDLRHGGSSPCRAVGCRAEAKLAKVQEKQHQLRQMERQLRELARTCRAHDAPGADCPMLKQLWSGD